VVIKLDFLFSFHHLEDSAVILQLKEECNQNPQEKIQMIVTYLEEHPPKWMYEYIPSLRTVAIFYDPLKVSICADAGRLPYDTVCIELQKMIEKLRPGKAESKQVIEIPVCYGGHLGPDLPFVAEHNNLTIEEVIKIHSSCNYLVYMIGFSPGFPYLGGMSDKIAVPRKQTPRLKIPAGSVGIAGKQTGIYPIETPGGWQLIGRTPLNLFCPNHKIPSLLRAGDTIKFKAISPDEYLALEEKSE
jgi:inhibitor of KinA